MTIELKLVATKVASNLSPGYYLDGQGLYLQVRKGGTKSWIYRYFVKGVNGAKDRQREMGLGSYGTGRNCLTLQAARDKCQEYRDRRRDGHDPIDFRDDNKAKVAADAEAKRLAEQAKLARKTFDECADAYIELKAAEWKPGGGSEEDWRAHLRIHASPIIGKLPVDQVTTDHVLRVLEPIWRTKTETATRVRGHIEKVLNAAKGRGLRTGENPASWSHLSSLGMPSPRKVTKVEHHQALPYQQVGAFMRDLRGYREPRKHPGLAANALEFIILTATRSGEVRGAKWLELDLDAATWTIPAERMKMGKEHVVPLSRAALELLASLPIGDSEYVFPNTRGEPLSDMAPLQVLRRMRVPSTVHGFRSSFTDWCAETTNYPNIVRDMALAHKINSQVEAAYRRGDLLEKRSPLMEDWAVYCGTVAVTATVVPIREGVAA